MAKPKASTGNIAGIYRAETIGNIVFGAIHLAHKENPTRSMNDIAESVLSTFGIKSTSVGSLLKIYYRVESAFLNNGGINE